MKRKLFIVVAVVAAIFLLTACGKFTCGVCGETKSGSSFKDELLGVKVTTCENCHKALENLADVIDDEGNIDIDDLKDALGDLDLDEIVDKLGDVSDDLGDALNDLKDSLGEDGALSEALNELEDIFN